MTISHKSKLLILLVVSISLATGVLATNYVEKRIQSTGYIYTPNPNIEVYSDLGYTTILTQVNWGTLTAGDTPTYTICARARAKQFRHKFLCCLLGTFGGLLVSQLTFHPEFSGEKEG